MDSYDLDRPYSNRLDTDAVVRELQRVARLLGNRRFSRREFDEHAETCKGSTVLKNFGTWEQALRATELDLVPHRASRTQITNSELLVELGRVWRLVGHRPSKGEWESVDSQYSYTTYKQRFGGWVKACVAFVEGSSFTDETSARPPEEPPRAAQSKAEAQSRNPRYVPLKLRLKVLQRDRFSCIACGRSPAQDVGVQLHVDHILPFSKGGATIDANLQTLCRECNLGKGGDETLAGPV